MTQTPALTSDELTALAGIHTRETFLAPFPATEIATARVNGSLAYPIAQIPTTSESAGWTDVKAGMVLLIGTAAGLADVARFRVRNDVSGTGSVDVGQFGTGDTGSVAFNDPIAIANAQYITVVNTRDIHAVFPRIDYAGGTTASIYEDYNRTDIIRNLQPSPVVRISTNNSSGGHYGVKVADGATVAITSTATVEHWPSSSSVLSYAWEYPAGFTSVSGASTATLTATAPVGNHEISCTVTPDYGQPITAVRYIIVCDDTTNPPIRIANINSDTRNRTARRVSLTLNDTAITSIPNGSGVIMWEQCTWNSTSVPTATTTFVGWLSQVGYGFGGLKSTTPEIIGVGEVLNLLTNSSQLFEVATVPTVWQQMGYSLATYNWCIWWLLTYRASNVLTLFSFHPYSTSASVGRLPAFDVGGGSLLSQVNSLADRYRKSSVGSNSGGELFVSLPPHMNTTAERSSLVTRVSLTASRLISVGMGRSVFNQVRQVEGKAFTWDGSAALPTPLLSLVPESPAQGSQDDTLDNQIVDSQTTLNQITGLYRAWVNAPIKQVTFAVAGNWDVVEPVEMTLVNVTLPAILSPDGVEWQFDSVPLSVSKRDMGGGATEMEFTVDVLTSGASGKTVPVPPPGENLDPSLPPIDDVFPDEPFLDWGPELDIDPADEIQLDPQPGAAVEYSDIYGGTDDGHAWKVTNGTFTDISPSSGLRTVVGTVYQLVQDAWNYSIGYMVGRLGILRCTGINGASRSWAALFSYAAPTTDSGSYDFTGGDELDWQLTPTPNQLTFDFNSYGTWGGGGWQSQHYTDNPSHNTAITLRRDFATTVHLTDITLEGVCPTTNFIEWHFELRIHYGGIWATYTTWNTSGWAAGSYSNTLDFTPASIDSFAVDAIEIFAYARFDNAEHPSGGVFTLTSIELSGAEFPFAAGSDETIIGAFQTYTNKQNAYCWLSKKGVSGTDYVFFNRTLDNFSTRQQVSVARYAADMHYSIAISPHNWRFVFVTAGDPAESDAYVYKSADGGGGFTSTGVALYTHGGQLSWNWSTSTPNTPNTSNANLLIVRGLDGSDNLLIRVGTAGSDVTIANGAGKYGLQPDSLSQLPRDGDFVVFAAQDNSVRKSSNFATSFSSGTGGSGTQVYGLWRWPTDDAFAILYGDEELEYTIDTFSTYVDMYSAYSTFASGAYSSGGTVIVSAWVDLGQHYIRPVASEA